MMSVGSRLSVFVELSKGKTLMGTSGDQSEIPDEHSARGSGERSDTGDDSTNKGKNAIDLFEASGRNLKKWISGVKSQKEPGSMVTPLLFEKFDDNKTLFEGIADRSQARSRELVEKGFIIFSGNLSYKGDSIGCSFSDQSNPEICPFVQRDGAIDAYFAHLLPALMINNVMKAISSYAGNYVETRVLCQGTAGFKNRWWYGKLSNGNVRQTSIDIVDHIIISPAFGDVLRELSGWVPIDGKNVFRLCIWIIVPEHVFMLVWETHFSVGGSIESSICFAVDNLTSNSKDVAEDLRSLVLVRECVVDQFISKLNEYIEKSRNGEIEGLVSELEKLSLKENKIISDGKNIKDDAAIEHVKIESLPSITKPLGFEDVPQGRDMVCVSFMARCTLYLSMVNDCRFMFLVGHFSYATGLDFERECYRAFQFHLKLFIESADREGRLVLFHPVNHPFVDISKICLVTIESDIEHPLKSRIYYQYQGSGYGFVPIGTGDNPPRHGESTSKKPGIVCTVSSQFTTTTPPLTQPVSFRTTVLFRTEESLARIRECQSLLKGLRLRKVVLQQ